MSHNYKLPVFIVTTIIGGSKQDLNTMLVLLIMSYNDD